MNQKEFEQVKAKMMQVANENFDMMTQSKGSIYDYNPYTRYYMENENENKMPKIMDKIKIIQKRSKKK